MQRTSLFVAVVMLGLTVVLVGCGGKNGGAFDATGYQGKLDDGFSFVYIETSDGNAMISLIDAEHTGDDALTYTGKPVEGEDGKFTVTDDESGESITYTITKNDDGTASVEVDGHGKGDLTAYEGKLFSVISEMAEDDEDSE